MQYRYLNVGQWFQFYGERTEYVKCFNPKTLEGFAISLTGSNAGKSFVVEYDEEVTVLNTRSAPTSPPSSTPETPESIDASSLLPPEMYNKWLTWGRYSDAHYEILKALLEGPKTRRELDKNENSLRSLCAKALVGRQNFGQGAGTKYTYSITKLGKDVLASRPS